jgi:hypothetical protein
MLRNRTWQRLADSRESLCFLCLFERARERQVELGLDDLRMCQFNLFHRPHSWYDEFLSPGRLRRHIKKQPPDDLVEDWRAYLRVVEENERIRKDFGKELEQLYRWRSAILEQLKPGEQLSFSFEGTS